MNCPSQVRKDRHHQLISFSLILLAVVLLPFSACNQTEKKPENQPENDEQKNDSQPITIVVLDSSDEQMESFSTALNREFEFLKLGKVSFKYADTREFLASPIEGDLVLYPPQQFGELIKRNLVREIPDYLTNAEAYAKNDVLKRQRGIFCNHGGARYAVSLGVSSLYLMARVDILESNGLSVPTTWNEYQEACAKLSQLKSEGNLKGVSPTVAWSPTIEPLKDNWLATTVVARSAAYVRTRGKYSVLFDYSTWTPLINAPPFARSIEELKKVVQLMAPSHRALSPREVEQAFQNGQSVFAIGWPHPAMADKADKSAGQLKAGLFPLPGTTNKYDSASKKWGDSSANEKQIPVLGVGGLCGSVLSSSKKSGVATRRLGLLAGKDFSARLAQTNPHGFPFRASHLSKIDSWVDSQYSDSFKESFIDQIEADNETLVWMVRPRVEKAIDYERVLADETRKYFDGQDEATTLSNVDQKWREINQGIEPEFQQSISLEGLGIR